MTLADLALSVRNMLPIIHKPEVSIIGPVDKYRVGAKSDTLELYVNAQHIPGISQAIYQPLYLGLQKPFVAEILRDLQDGKEAKFDGILDPNITRVRDDFERIDKGALIRLRGRLELGDRVYWTEFNIDWHPFLVGYLYHTNLVNIRRE